MKRRKSQNYKFEDSLIVNEATYVDYLNRFRRIALSIFEWVNLPKSMDARYLEQCLYYNGQASLLYDKNYGFINTKCAGSGYVNIEGDVPEADLDKIRSLFNNGCTFWHNTSTFLNYSASNGIL